MISYDMIHTMFKLCYALCLYYVLCIMYSFYFYFSLNFDITLVHLCICIFEYLNLGM